MEPSSGGASQAQAAGGRLADPSESGVRPGVHHVLVDRPKQSGIAPGQLQGFLWNHNCCPSCGVKQYRPSRVVCVGTSTLSSVCLVSCHDHSSRPFLLCRIVKLSFSSGQNSPQIFYLCSSCDGISSIQHPPPARTRPDLVRHLVTMAVVDPATRKRVLRVIVVSLLLDLVSD